MNYKDYVHIQKQRGSQKWGSKGFYKYRLKEFQQVMEYFNKESLKTIACMGIRNGNEYFETKKLFPKSKVYGIDICDEVKNVGENCYALDFNKLPIEWGNKFDLIYSNSLDHALDVKKTLKEWARVSKKYVVLCLSEAEINEADRHSFNKEDYDKIIDKKIYKIIKIIGRNIILEIK